MKPLAHFGFAFPYVAFAIALLPPADAVAVEARVYQLENGGAIAPHLTIELGMDNNPLRGEAGSESAAFARIGPNIRYIVQRRNNKLTAAYEGHYLQYFDEFCSEPIATENIGIGNFVERPGDCASSTSTTIDKASYQDHALGLNGFLEISRRARATIDFSTSRINQPLGTGLSANNSVLTTLTEPDTLIRNNARAAFSYGAYQARGELRLALNYLNRSFRENGGRDLDNLGESFLEPSASIFYRVGTRTQVFAGFSVSDVKGGNSERAISRQFVGLEFDASAITSGSVRVNFVTEDFDNSTRGDLDYTGFDVDLTWRPRRFSTVAISAGRETQRATLSEAVGITTEADIEWFHSWRDRISTTVKVGIERNESIGRTSSNEANDRTNVVRFDGNYSLRRWVDVGAFMQIDSRSGRSVNGESRDYSRTVMGLTANGTF